jgi:hypothetical protein
MLLKSRKYMALVAYLNIDYYLACASVDTTERSNINTLNQTYIQRSLLEQIKNDSTIQMTASQ